MADNYLEKKMEELRSGRKTVSRSGRGTAVAGSNQLRKGYLSFRLDAKRILVNVPAYIAPAVCRGYVKAGCSVAYAGHDPEFGKELAYQEGIRFYDMTAGSFPDFSSVVTDITRVWHDLDLAVFYVKSEADIREADIRAATETATAWADFRNTHPHISDCGGRLLLLIENPAIDNPAISNPAKANSAKENPAIIPSVIKIKGILAKAGISTISLSISSESANQTATLAKQIQWLSLSQAAILPGILLP